LPKKTLAKIKKAGCEGILQVKDNQLNLKRKIEREIKLNKELSSEVMIEKNRNRIETRIIKVYPVRQPTQASLINDNIWNNWNLYIRSIIHIEKSVEIFSYKTNSRRISKEEHLYVATYEDNAKGFANHIRKHWLCENSNHYVRDQTLMEDYSRIRKNPLSLAILRSFILNILRFNKETNIRAALYRNCCSIQKIFEYSGIF